MLGRGLRADVLTRHGRSAVDCHGEGVRDPMGDARERKASLECAVPAEDRLLVARFLVAELSADAWVRRVAVAREDEVLR